MTDPDPGEAMLAAERAGVTPLGAPLTASATALFKAVAAVVIVVWTL